MNSPSTRVKVSTPSLGGIRLLSFAADNSLFDAYAEPGGRPFNVNMTLNRAITVGVTDRKRTGAAQPLVTIVFTVSAKPGNANAKDEARLNAVAKYEARFLSFEGLADDADSEKLLVPSMRRELVLQAHPVVMAHFMSQLKLMGLNTNGIPLGFVESVGGAAKGLRPPKLRKGMPRPK